MIDRELLELAAKAAGIAADIEWAGPNETEGNFYYKGHLYRTWNPLTDDGDALRLAVKLGLVLSPSTVSAMCWLPGRIERGEVWEKLGDDRFGATRRAITRAAAEIGRSMP